MKVTCSEEYHQAKLYRSVTSHLPKTLLSRFLQSSHMHWFLHLNTCQDYEKHFPLHLSFYVCCQYLLKSELNYTVPQHFSGDSVILRTGQGINNSSKAWSSLEIIIMKSTIWSLLTDVKKPISKFQSWPLNYRSLERITVHRRVCIVWTHLKRWWKTRNGNLQDGIQRVAGTLKESH